MPLIEPKNTNPSSPENCRTCVDFKSWAKQQRKSLTTTEVNFLMSCEINHRKKIFVEERGKGGCEGSTSA